jgi:hypothetical protein
MHIEFVILGFFIGGAACTLGQLVIMGRAEAAKKRLGNAKPASAPPPRVSSTLEWTEDDDLRLAERATRISMPPFALAHLETSPGESVFRYDISHLLLYWARCDFDKRDIMHRRCYRALCAAYGIPTDWRLDQALRHKANQTWSADSDEPPVQVPTNGTYPAYRADFLEVDRRLAGVMMDCGNELAQEVLVNVSVAHQASRKYLRRLDELFFGRVYGVDVKREFTEEESAPFGMPSRSEQIDDHFESA